MDFIKTTHLPFPTIVNMTRPSTGKDDNFFCCDLMLPFLRLIRANRIAEAPTLPLARSLLWCVSTWPHQNLAQEIRFRFRFRFRISWVPILHTAPGIPSLPPPHSCNLQKSVRPGGRGEGGPFFACLFAIFHFLSCSSNA
jgi:hypothetical protein